jgi:predicted CoA-binding protein
MITMAMPENPDKRSIKELLTTAKTIAVVGLSADPSKDSHEVAAYMKAQGYRIIPINPGAEEILGERSYPDLRSIPDPVDIVDVFRRSEYVPEIADQAIEIGAKALWMQVGIRNEQAALTAQNAGIIVVSGKCIKVQHRRLIRDAD